MTTRPPDGYTLRGMMADDIDPLISASRRATDYLASHGWPMLADEPFRPADMQALISGGDVIVAADTDDRAVGMAVAADVANAWYLMEIFVDPAHGRQGLGTALLNAVIDRARFGYYSAVALSTFRDVPFNKPFYERRGFMEYDFEQAPEELRARFLKDVPQGTPQAARALMILKL